jgi:Holliday junction resolvase-like predicted endonuclease
MINQMHKRKAIRAARLYLEMRGFKLLEQNWGLGKHKFDLIASKKELISFIDIDYSFDILDLSNNSLLTEGETNRIKNAIEAWTDQNKFVGKLSYSRLELGGPDFSILNFNENIV